MGPLVTSPDPYHHLAGVYDEIVVDPCHASWADAIEHWWADDTVHDVLDLACGSGLMTAELASRGYRVTGLDASEAMLARARTRLDPDVPLVRSWLPHLPVAGPFDAVVSTLDGLNYLTVDALRATFAALATVLRPGGWLVFDMHADPALRFLRDHPVITGDEHGVAYTLSTHVDGVTCTSTIVVASPDAADAFTETHVQHVHPEAVIRQALADAGLVVVRVTDEYTDDPVGPDTLRASWVARRP